MKIAEVRGNTAAADAGIHSGMFAYLTVMDLVLHGIGAAAAAVVQDTTLLPLPSTPSSLPRLEELVADKLDMIEEDGSIGRVPLLTWVASKIM